MRRARGIISATLVTLLATACSGTGTSEADDAEEAALTFYEGLRSRPADACALLAPGTLQELESSEGPCADSIGKQEIPEASAVAHVDVYGKQAMVELDGDVAFLAHFSAGWKVTAAGCVANGERHPYECSVKGS